MHQSCSLWSNYLSLICYVIAQILTHSNGFQIISGYIFKSVTCITIAGI
jgi:hypothetical protein